MCNFKAASPKNHLGSGKQKVATGPSYPALCYGGSSITTFLSSSIMLIGMASQTRANWLCVVSRELQGSEYTAPPEAL